MEFFQKLKAPNITTENLKEELTIKNLTKYCDEITSISLDNGSDGVIYCIWGEFFINREELSFGVRFTMPKCPNAFSWTITKDDGDSNIIIHSSINKSVHDEDFIDSINDFMMSWKNGLQELSHL